MQTTEEQILNLINNKIEELNNLISKDKDSLEKRERQERLEALEKKNEKPVKKIKIEEKISEEQRRKTLLTEYSNSFLGGTLASSLKIISTTEDYQRRISIRENQLCYLEYLKNEINALLSYSKYKPLATEIDKIKSYGKEFLEKTRTRILSK